MRTEDFDDYETATRALYVEEVVERIIRVILAIVFLVVSYFCLSSLEEESKAKKNEQQNEAVSCISSSSISEEKTTVDPFLYGYRLNPTTGKFTWGFGVGPFNYFHIIK